MFQIFNARPIKKAMGNIPVGKFPISLSAAVAVDCGRRLLRRIYRLAKPYSYALCCSKQVQAPRFVFSGTGFKLQSSSRGRTFRMIPGFVPCPSQDFSRGHACALSVPAFEALLLSCP